MYNWRLLPSVVAYIPTDANQKSVYIASGEKKSYQLAVSTKINQDYFPIDLTENKIDEVRVVLGTNNNLCLEIKSSKFPTNDWYALRNFDIRTIGMIMTQVDCSKGVFKGEFEVVFNVDSPEQVSLISQSMCEYKDCLSEMSRRLTCELGKKTKKWVPGHKYETMECTYIYLGSVLSRKLCSNKSSFLPDLSMVEAHLFVTNLKDNEHSISDVLNNRIISLVDPDGIKILYSKLKTAVDSGEVLKNDFSGNIQDYWNNLFDNTSNKFLTKTAFGRDVYSNIKDILDIFSLQSEGYLDYNNDVVKTKLPEVFKVWAWDTLVNCWEKNLVESLRINNTLDIDKNAEHLSKLSLFYVRDENVFATDYYDSLIKELNIDLVSISKEVLNNWDTEKFNNDFDFFTKNLEFLSRSVGTGHYINQRVNSSVYSYRTVRPEDAKLSKYFGEGELRDRILELVSYATANHGAGVSNFNSYCVGTVKSPKHYSVCEMSLRDLLNFVNSEMKMTDSLKSEIMDKKFISLTIEFDKDSTII